MKVGIIGAGFTGLAAAYKLLKQGAEVVVLEKEGKLGGLASGFREKNWDWTLERHYHHIFSSDNLTTDLAKKLGVKVFFKRPKSSTYLDGKIYQLDSPLSLLKFPKLDFTSRVRTGLSLFCLKYLVGWNTLEGLTAEKFIKFFMGGQSWSILWKPLFEGKFGKFAEDISAAWFWARIKKRSFSLGYFESGFQRFADALGRSIEQNGGKLLLKTEVGEVKKKANHVEVKTLKKNYKFDSLICTLPFSRFVEKVRQLPLEYKKNLLDQKGLGAINVVLSLKHQLLADNSYWLNINSTRFPFLAVVEHTNFIDKKNYNNESLIYVANYLLPDHDYFEYSKEKLVNKFIPYLKKINQSFDKSWIKRAYVFKDSFAQPVVPVNYSTKVPKIKTPVEGIYLANMQQVYPWDRGLNYAIELGYKVADLVIKFI